MVSAYSLDADVLIYSLTMKHILISEEEAKELIAAQKSQFISDDMRINNWPGYHTKLTKWTDKIRKVYKLKDDEPFTFSEFTPSKSKTS